MKKLYLVRHAKSSWEDESLNDFDRPLNERGQKDAPKMGKRLKRNKVQPDLMLSSPAVRALATCEAIAEALDYPKDKIITDKRLYHAGPKEILAVIKDLDGRHKSAFTLMLFGHNPGLTEFANRLFKDSIDNIPTCGVVAGVLSISNWEEINWSGKHLFFDYPKKER